MQHGDPVGELTPTTQQAEVGEGLAVGCLLIGVVAVGCDTDPVDAAFSAAFTSWAWSARYPTFLRGRPPSLDPVLRRSANRRPRRAAHWTVSRGLHVPQLLDDDWDLGAACSAVEEDTAIAARHWAALATTFVAGLRPERVWRHAPPRCDDHPGLLAVDP